MATTEQRTDELIFLPLGGAGEIGMNLNLYGCGGKWLMVDLGVTFGDDSLPGIDLVLPDPRFIAERREDLLGLVLTHAHEDHLGAVPHLWPRLGCPVYATPFAAAILRHKLREAGLLRRVPLNEIGLGGSLTLEPFEVSFIPVTHSIPEANALVIRTPLGTVLHTGDWKLDPEPMLGPLTDERALKDLGEDGVVAMVCDSTNVFQSGESGSEAELRSSLERLVKRYRRRVAVTTFASHIARIETLAVVAAACGRHAVLVGRALWRALGAARESGYLGDVPPFLEAGEAGYLPPDKVLLVCAGCQGEPRGAISRIAFGQHADIALEAGDVVIFSSKIIPGNELAIGRVHNQLVRGGIEVITEKDHFVHVSGHPNRGELERMYRWVRPRLAVPVHGEPRHLYEHARLARSLGVPEVVVPANGALVRLAPEPAGVVGQVPAGRLVLDGERLIEAESPAIKARRRAMHSGSAVATLVADGEGRLLAPPSVVVFGLDGAGADCEAEAARAVADAVAGLPAAVLRDDHSFAEAARRAARRSLKASSGKRPLVQARIIRLPSPQGRMADKQGEGVS